MRLKEGLTPPAIILIALFAWGSFLSTAVAGNGRSHYSHKPNIAATKPNVAATKSFRGIPGKRPTTKVDETVFSMADDAMATISNGIHDAITARLSRFKNTTIAAARAASAFDDGDSGIGAPGGTTGDFALPNIGGWTQVFGLSDDAWTRKPLDPPNSFSGATVGFDLPLSEHAIAGFFFGGSTGSLKDSQADQNVSTNGFYGGLYVIHQVGDYFIDLTLGGGLTRQDTRRFDFDSQNAEASYSGYFVNPSLTVSTHGQIGNQLIVPSVSMVYSGFFYGNYSEKGSPQSLKVIGRQTHVLSGRTQIAVPYEHVFFSGTKLTFEGRGGVDARFDLSGRTTTSTQGGLELNFRPEDNLRELGVFLGAEATYTLQNGVLLYGEVEGIVSTTGSVDAYTQFGTRFSF